MHDRLRQGLDWVDTTGDQVDAREFSIVVERAHGRNVDLQPCLGGLSVLGYEVEHCFQINKCFDLKISAEDVTDNF